MVKKLDENLIGKIFGRWVVISKAPDKIDKNSGKHKTSWLCECVCKNKTQRIVTGTALRTGRSKSCGCIRDEKSKSKINKGRKIKPNIYDLSGEYGIGYTKEGEKFYFDLEDYDKIKKYNWHIHNGYLIARSNYKIIRIHRIIMNAKENELVDHKNHNTLDNRKKNLRLCNNQKNCFNHIVQKNNTSGVSGVSWDKEYNKWRARLWIGEKCIHLGRFINFEDAVKVRNIAEVKYFKDFRYKEE